MAPSDSSLRYWFYYAVRTFLRLFFRLGFGLEVTGQEHVPARGPFIVAANHLSYFDPPLMGAACPRRLSFMARADLFKNWLLGAFMRGVHVIPLQRGEGDLAAIREAVIRLRRGDAVAIFPEGGRQLSGRLGMARRGVGLLAEAAEAPIIPTLIRGTFEALPSGARWPRRAKIRVAFGAPIPYTKPPCSPTSPPGDREAARRDEPSASRTRHQALADCVTAAWQRLAAANP